jgi:hypothetical protein
MILTEHNVDGFTLSDYVMNKYGHELYIKTRYIGYNLTDAKKAFKKKCKDIIKNENNVFDKQLKEYAKTTNKEVHA